MPTVLALGRKRERGGTQEGGREEGHKREGENLDIIYRSAKLTSKQPDTESLSLLENTEENDIKE